MGENLVVNGDFGREWDHRWVYVCEQGGPPRQMPTANCFIQEPWEFWWEQGPDLHLPEVKDAWGHIDADRVRSGEKAIQFFKTWDQYHAGFWQVVEVPGLGRVTVFLAAREQWGFCHNDVYWDDVSLVYEGGQLILSAFCHAWSNHDIEGHRGCLHDPRCSAGVGRGPYAMPYDATPEPNGDPWNDAIRNVSIRLGIDETAGTDPLAARVRWSDWQVVYNVYQELSLALAVNQPSLHEVDYEVTVRVPAQSRESFRRVAQDAEEGLNSVVPSHDDAGRLCDVVCPSGKGGEAILYDIPREEREGYVAWYAERYPRARVTFAPPDEAWEWEDVLLAQGDPRWGDHVYADGGCYTLASQGCFITCCAMTQRLYGIDKEATPLSVDETLGAEGYDRCLLLHSALPKLGFEIVKATWDREEALDHLWPRGAVFVEVAPASLMHFVLAVEYDAARDDLLVLDPWKNVVGWLEELYEGAESYRLIEDVEEEPALARTPLLAMHVQNNVAGLPAVVGEMGAVKLVEDIGVVDHIPEAFVVYRNWLTGEQVHEYQYQPLRHFADHLQWVLDYYGDVVDAVEDGMNERIGPSNRDENLRMIEHALETARLVREHSGGKIKTVMLNPGPGAFPLEWIGDFDPVFEVSHRYGDYIGLHPYTPAIGDEAWVDEWYPLRFMQIDTHARAWGWRPLYLGTEAGPIGGTVHVREDGVRIPVLNAGAGWRSRDCLGGRWEGHQDVMGRTARAIQEWNAAHGNRMRWLFLFTVTNSGWEDFRYWEGEMREVAALGRECMGDG